MACICSSVSSSPLVRPIIPSAAVAASPSIMPRATSCSAVSWVMRFFTVLCISGLAYSAS